MAGILEGDEIGIKPGTFVKDNERAAAISYLRRHPAHGDRKTAAAVSFRAARGRWPERGELRAFLRDPRARWAVTARCVGLWRTDAGLAPAAPRGHTPPRRKALPLACGHGLGAPHPDDDATVWCWRCHTYINERPQLDHREQPLPPELEAALSTADPPPPDTMPPDPHPHFVDRPAAEVLGDLAAGLRDWLREGH